MKGSDVMSITRPTEPALVNSVNYVNVNVNQQTERLNLSQCQLKVTGTSVCTPGVLTIQ